MVLGQGVQCTFTVVDQQAQEAAAYGFGAGENADAGIDICPFPNLADAIRAMRRCH